MCVCVCVCVCACMYACTLCLQLYLTLFNPQTVSHQASLSMGFSRQEYWSGLSCHPPGDLPGPGMEPALLMSPVLAGGFFTARTTWEAQVMCAFLKCFYLISQCVSCGMQGSSIFTETGELLVASYGIPDQGSNSGPLHWESGVLATGLSGKSLK